MNDFRFIPDQEHFDLMRRDHLGASDFVILLGLSTYLTPYDKWRIMTGRDNPPETSIRANWGHRHEGNILASYIEETENEVIAFAFELDYIKHRYLRPSGYQPATQYLPYTEFIHPEIPWPRIQQRLLY